MKKKNWIAGACALILVGAAAYHFAFTPRRQEEPASVTAPDFTYHDLHGKPVSLSSFRGQVVLLDFWATWCGPCEEEVPELKKLYAHYKDRGFTIVGVSMDSQGPEVVSSFVKEHGIDYPILVSGGQPPEGYPIPGFPTAFLIDRKGTVLQRYLGEMTYEDLSQDVEQTLSR